MRTEVELRQNSLLRGQTVEIEGPETRLSRSHPDQNTRFSWDRRRVKRTQCDVHISERRLACVRR